MEFRWVAGLTLWTVLSGPVLVGIHSMMPMRKEKAELHLPAHMLTSTATAVPTALMDLERPARSGDHLVLYHH